MTTAERLWMTRQAQIRLREELAALRSHPRTEVPDDFMDNGEKHRETRCATEYAYARSKTCCAMPSSMRIHPTTESPNPEWS